MTPVLLLLLQEFSIWEMANLGRLICKYASRSSNLSIFSSVQVDLYNPLQRKVGLWYNKLIGLSQKKNCLWKCAKTDVIVQLSVSTDKFCFLDYLSTFICDVWRCKEILLVHWLSFLPPSSLKRHESVWFFIDTEQTMFYSIFLSSYHKKATVALHFGRLFLLRSCHYPSFLFDSLTFFRLIL